MTTWIVDIRISAQSGDHEPVLRTFVELRDDRDAAQGVALIGVSALFDAVASEIARQNNEKD